MEKIKQDIFAEIENCLHIITSLDQAIEKFEAKFNNSFRNKTVGEFVDYERLINLYKQCQEIETRRLEILLDKYNRIEN